MQPLILGILEKQLKTDHLSTTLSTSCPIINRDADEALQGLHKPWLEDHDKKTEARVNEIKVGTARTSRLCKDLHELILAIMIGYNRHSLRRHKTRAFTTGVETVTTMVS